MKEELTYYQKLAIEGEVSAVLLKSAHNDEMLSRIYIILKHIPDSYKVAALEVIKEIVDLPETDLARVMLATQEESYPVWLWINRIMSDVRMALGVSHSESSSKISVDKKLAKSKVVSSAFAYFLRKAGVVSKTATLKLCEKMLGEDNEYDFLYPTIFTVLEEIKEVEEDKIVRSSIGDVCFDTNEMLSAKRELAVIEMIKEMEDEDEAVSEVKVCKISLSQELSPDEVAEKINREILKVFNSVTGDSEEEEFKEETKYLVRKRFTGSDKATTLKVFDTEEEAKAFIDNIKEKFPELEKTCEFEVTKAIKK